MLEWLNNIDVRLFLFLNGIHSEFWDPVMVFTSGRLSWIPLYAFILYLIIKKYKKKSWIIVLSIIVLITLSDQISVHFFKNIFERLRPCKNPEFKEIIHVVNDRCGGNYGFVSSHAANTFALAIFTLLLLNSRLYSIAIISWATLVSYSRIYLGRHYPGDVIGGALLGILIGYIVYYIYKLVKKE